jgi:flagellar hook assembly protein FlgD
LSAGNPLFLRGKAGETALANVNFYHSNSGDSISVSVIDSIFYRVDGGAWVSLPADDGVFDEGEEFFHLTLAPLSIGSHTIDWQAKNSNGRSAAVNATTAVTVSGSAGAVDSPDGGTSRALGLSVFPSPGRGPIRFSVSGAHDGTALVRLWTATGRLVRTWRTAPSAAGSTWTWDGRLGGGERAASGIYFVTVESGGERVRRRLVFLR